MKDFEDFILLGESFAELVGMCRQCKYLRCFNVRILLLCRQIFIDFVDPFWRFYPVNDRHMQVHHDEVEVPLTALLADILRVALQPMQAIHTRLDLNVQYAFQLQLQRYDVVALIVDYQATIFAVAVRQCRLLEGFIVRLGFVRLAQFRRDSVVDALEPHLIVVFFLLLLFGGVIWDQLEVLFLTRRHFSFPSFVFLVNLRLTFWAEAVN